MTQHYLIIAVGVGDIDNVGVEALVGVAFEVAVIEVDDAGAQNVGGIDVVVVAVLDAVIVAVVAVLEVVVIVVVVILGALFLLLELLAT